MRMSLTTEEKEANQSITRGNFRLVAKLNQLKIKAKKSAAVKNDDMRGEVEESQEGYLGRKTVMKLDNRSKLHRNKLYRQPTMASFDRSVLQEATSSREGASVEGLVDGGELQHSGTPDLTKYQIPSWQRAEIIAKQHQEKLLKQKIYGKKRQ